jgi:hypothetical protein
MSSPTSIGHLLAAGATGDVNAGGSVGGFQGSVGQAGLTPMMPSTPVRAESKDSVKRKLSEMSSSPGILFELSLFYCGIPHSDALSLALSFMLAISLACTTFHKL